MDVVNDHFGSTIELLFSDLKESVQAAILEELKGRDNIYTSNIRPILEIDVNEFVEED